MKLLTLLLLSTTILGLARQPGVADKNITWYSEQNVEKHSGITMNTPIRIATKARNSIDLIVEDQTMSFTIQSVSGSWMNENEDGELVYSVKYNNEDPGKITISRSGGITNIIIDFTGANPEGMHQEFLVSRVETN